MELATAQHGVVATRQLKGIGYSRNSASKANSVHRLYRLHRGVYAVGHRTLSWQGEHMAAVLARAPAVVSHSSAGWMHGLLRYRPSQIHLTVPSERRQLRPFVVHFATLARKDIARVDRIPVTAWARTVLDLAGTLSPERLERVLDRSEELKLFDLSLLDDVLARAAGHRGGPALRQALEIYRPDPAMTKSGLERCFRRIVAEAGIPAYSVNFNVAGYEIDAYWPEHRFGVELDTYWSHGSPASFEEDRIRDEALKLAGIRTIRITDKRLAREPAAVMERLRRHLELG